MQPLFSMTTWERIIFALQMGPLRYYDIAEGCYKPKASYFDMHWNDPAVVTAKQIVKRHPKDLSIEKLPDPERKTIVSYIFDRKKKPLRPYASVHEAYLGLLFFQFLKAFGSDLLDWRRPSRHFGKDLFAIKTKDGEIIHEPDRYAIIKNNGDTLHVYLELERTRKSDERTNRIFDRYRAAVKQGTIPPSNLIIWIADSKEEMEHFRKLASERQVPDSLVFTLLSDIIENPRRDYVTAYG